MKTRIALFWVLMTLLVACGDDAPEPSGSDAAIGEDLNPTDPSSDQLLGDEVTEETGVADTEPSDVGHDPEEDGFAPDDLADEDVDVNVPPCIEAQRSLDTDTRTWTDGDEQTVLVVSGEGCQREFVFTSTVSLRDGFPENPRTIQEQADGPVVHTGNDIFDGLYALALEEVEENSVSSIVDGAFDNGNPVSCGTAGCFETGRLWHYVWTRDIAYSVHLGLAPLDPSRARYSLELKLSQRREGGDLQIVQDTGSGGSYPVSTDRVVWALGAFELLKYLDGTERADFAAMAFEAISNTIEHDRQVVFDEEDGLYRGEQSFLDWREQSYPDWTENDTVHIGMSKALSTNVGHLCLLEIGAALALEQDNAALNERYGQWAGQLRQSVSERFFVAEYGLFSSFITTFLDPAPVSRFDLLGNALAVLYHVGDDNVADNLIANYPHLAHGPPVMWPQQQQVAIYHNRAIWPFVTAYWLRAARQVGNDTVVNHNVRSMINGAALNLSNMENFEMVTGRAWLDDGEFSGPVINSQRQLWSVAGYVSMVHDIIFGLEASQTGIRFSPFVTRELRNTLFRGSDSLVLNNFPYRNREITVVVFLPPVSEEHQGVYDIVEIHLNGELITDELIDVSALGPRNLLTIQLGDGPQDGGTLTLIEDTTDYRDLFSPLTPAIEEVALVGERLRVTFDPSDEAPSDITFNIYRDGLAVAEDLPGSTTQWVDPNTSADSPSHCYSIEAVFLVSNNASQHAQPICFWGASGERVGSIGADTFDNVGGTGVFNHGRYHFEQWGDDGHSLTVEPFVPDFTGEHLLQVVAGNGAGPVSTGITCGVKQLTVTEIESGEVVASGFLMMPQLGADRWELWEDSNFVRASLRTDRSYRITIASDETANNMSVFDHFQLYTAGLGGSEGPFNRVNIAELKVLSLTGNP